MKNKSITKEEYETRFPKSNENYFSILDEKAQDSYMLLYNTYSKFLVEHFINKFGLKEYDDILTNSENSYPKVSDDDMDIYQFQSSSLLNYVYIRNNLFIERLSAEEQMFLLSKVGKEELEYNAEMEDFITRTFKRVMLENPTDEDVRMINYGPDSISFFQPNNAIVFGIRYDDYQKLPGESSESWDEANQNRKFECETVAKIMRIKMSKDIGIPVHVIKYNEFSVKKKGYNEEGEKLK